MHGKAEHRLVVLSVRMSCQATLQGSNLRFRLVGHPLPRTWCLKTGAGWVGTVGKSSVAQCGTPRSFIRHFCERQMRLARPPWLMSVVDSSRACLAMAGCLSLTQFPAGGEVRGFSGPLISSPWSKAPHCESVFQQLSCLGKKEGFGMKGTLLHDSCTGD
jgi:hypothetical protein